MRFGAGNRLEKFVLFLVLLGSAASGVQAWRPLQHHVQSSTTGGSLRRLLQDQLSQEAQLVVSEEELQQELGQEDVVDFPLGTFGDEALVEDTGITERAQPQETEPSSTGAVINANSEADQLVVLNPDRAEGSPPLETALQAASQSTAGSAEITSGLAADDLTASTPSPDPATAALQREEALVNQLEGSDQILPEDLTDLATSTPQDSSSTNSSDPVNEPPILESALPSLEGVNDTLTTAANASLNTIRDSLQAVLGEPETTSNVSTSTGNSSNPVSNTTGLLGAAGNAESTNQTGSLLQQAASGLSLNASSLNSTLNATQDLLLSSASGAAAVLSNSSLLGTAVNQTLNTTQLAAQHASAGGIEGDTLLPGDIVNVTVANATLPETRQRVVDAAGSVIQDGKDAASGLLTGVQSWFNHSSTLNSTNTTAASGLYSGLSTTRNSTVSGAGSAGRYGQLTDGEEVDLDADLELAFSGSEGSGSGMHHSFNAINSSRNSTTGLPRTSTGHQASATTAESALNTSASSLPQTSALSVTANTANATSARSPAGQLSAMNTTAASSLGNTTLPFSGIRDQHSPDYLNDAAVEEDLTPEQIAELAEEHGNLSILSSSRGAAVASGVQRGSSSLTDSGSVAARNSSSRPGAGTAASPGLADAQRANLGVVRIPIEEDDYATAGGARTDSQTDTQSGNSNSHAASSLYADELENELEDGNSPMQGSRQPITGGSSSTRGTNTSTAGSPGSLSEAAQRREQERDAAYHASTGGMSQGSSRTNVGSIASASWGQLASRASNALRGNPDTKQHPTTSSLASELPYAEDDSSTGLLTSSTGGRQVGGGQSHVTGGQQHHASGSSGQDDVLSHRDSINPSSVVGAHPSWSAQSHTAQDGLQSGGVTAGNAKVSLAADADVNADLGSVQPNVMNHLQTDTDSSDGPLVIGSKEDDVLLPQASSGRQASRSSSQAYSLLKTIIDNWVVLSAFAALVGTGTVLGFVFVRGMVPSIDAVSFNTVGTSGYAGNANYSSVNKDDDGDGWDEGWAENDFPQSFTASHSPSNLTSPARASGMGKPKKGTFAKKKPEKKPDSWSNDF